MHQYSLNNTEGNNKSPFSGFNCVFENTKASVAFQTLYDGQNIAASLDRMQIKFALWSLIYN